MGYMYRYRKRECKWQRYTFGVHERNIGGWDIGGEEVSCIYECGALI
jgi:hypothetical protein